MLMLYAKPVPLKSEVCLQAARWVGGSRNAPKNAYIIFEWSLNIRDFEKFLKLIGSKEAEDNKVSYD